MYLRCCSLLRDVISVQRCYSLFRDVTVCSDMLQSLQRCSSLLLSAEEACAEGGLISICNHRNHMTPNSGLSLTNHSRYGMILTMLRSPRLSLMLLAVVITFLIHSSGFSPGFLPPMSLTMVLSSLTQVPQVDSTYRP